MAMNHYNKILIARGDKEAKTPLTGELFYDTGSKGVYVGTPDSMWKRFGGFDSLIIKGTIGSNTEYNSIISASKTEPLEPGDAYIITGPISVVQKEIVYKNDGTATRSDTAQRVYDDFFKAGQIIVYVEEDVSALPNSAVVREDGNYGFITLAGNTEANDLENDVSTQPIAKENGIYDVQSALDWLFNKKIEYKGEISSVDVTANAASSYSSGEELWAAIADANGLLPGEMIVYRGNTKLVTLSDESQFAIKKNTALLMVGSPTLVDDDNTGTENNKVETTVFTIPLGVSSASDVEFKFTGNRKMATDTQGDTSSIEADENSSKTISSDTDATTVQQALDVLHQTKADLNEQGKIPLEQIPNTFVGALQYIGTVDLTDQSSTALTAIELAKLMQAVGAADTDGWEDASEGNGAKNATATLDTGDYVIIKSTKYEASAEATDDNDGDTTQTVTRKQQYTIKDTSGNTLFTVSEGDHVIVNSITYGTDGTITDVTLDHLNTSSAVDAINNITAEVQIIGGDRAVQTSVTDSTAKTTLDETAIVTNTTNHTIQVKAPNTVLAANNLTKKTIPVGGGGKELNNSEVSINSYQDASGYKTGSDTTHNTELNGKTKDGTDVTVEFPDVSGKLLAAAEDGTKNRLPKYDKNGNLIDSDLENDADAGTFTVIDSDGNTVLTLNYGSFANLIKYALNGTDIIRRFDDEEYTSAANRKTTDTNVHTILDDCSVIDGGDWS